MSIEHHLCLLAEMDLKLLDAEVRAEMVLDHGLAFARRHADHGVAEFHGHGRADGLGRRVVGLDIDSLGVDQQAVHIENSGLNRFFQHGFVLSSGLETANDKPRAGENSCASIISMLTQRARRISAMSRSNGSIRAGAARPRTRSRQPASFSGRRPAPMTTNGIPRRAANTSSTSTAASASRRATARRAS